MVSVLDLTNWCYVLCGKSEERGGEGGRHLSYYAGLFLLGHNLRIALCTVAEVFLSVGILLHDSYRFKIAQ